MTLSPVAEIDPTKTKMRFPLAKASSRILGRVIDAVIVLALSFGIGLIIIATDSEGIRNALNLRDHWRYFLIAVMALIIFTGYFIFLPFWWNGQTVGMKIMRLRMVNLIPTKKFLWNITKRECFLWPVIAATNLVLSIIIWSIGIGDPITNRIDIFSQLLWTTTATTYSAFLQAFYAIGGLLLLFVVIHMCVMNKKRCFIDHISDTAIIKLDAISDDNNISSNMKVKPRKRNYGLPGEITAEANEEIDSL